MKCFVIFLAACITGSFAGGLRDGLAQFASVCALEIEVDQAALGDLRNGIVRENNPNLDCFIACILKRGGIVNEDNTFNEQGFRSRIPNGIPEENIQTVLQTCRWIEALHGCESARRLAECYLTNQKIALLLL